MGEGVKLHLLFPIAPHRWHYHLNYCSRYHQNHLPHRLHYARTISTAGPWRNGLP